MFKLYIDKGTRKMIDVSESEQDIIDTMGEYIRNDLEARFLIIESRPDGDDIRGFIRNPEEYVAYAEHYNEMLKRKSCVELKRDIVKNVKVKKIGSRKN